MLAAEASLIILIVAIVLIDCIYGCGPIQNAWPHVLAGALMQGVYLSASYWAIARGLAVGVMALLGALQPLFTALFMVATRRTKLATGVAWTSHRIRWRRAGAGPDSGQWGRLVERADSRRCAPERRRCNSGRSWSCRL